MSEANIIASRFAIAKSCYVLERQYLSKTLFRGTIPFINDTTNKRGTNKVVTRSFIHNFYRVSSYQMDTFRLATDNTYHVVPTESDFFLNLHVFRRGLLNLVL